MNCAHTAADRRGRERARRGHRRRNGANQPHGQRLQNVARMLLLVAGILGNTTHCHLPFLPLSLSRTLTDRQTTLIDYLNVCGAIVVPLSVHSPSPSSSPAHSRFPIPQRFTQQSSTDCPRTPPSPAQPASLATAAATFICVCFTLWHLLFTVCI